MRSDRRRIYLTVPPHKIPSRASIYFAPKKRMREQVYVDDAPAKLFHSYIYDSATKPQKKRDEMNGKKKYTLFIRAEQTHTHTKVL